jgi:hypothetical protein
MKHVLIISRISITLMTLGILVLCLPTAEADSISINFTAEIVYVDDMYCFCLPQDISVGDTIHGYYIYDSDTLDSNPDPHVGDYTYSTPPNCLVVFAGNHIFRTDFVNVDNVFVIHDSVTDGGLHDYYSYSSYKNVLTIPGYPTYRIWISLIDKTGTALSSDSLPLTAPDLNNWLYEKGLHLAGVGFVWNIQSILLSVTAGDPQTGVEERESNLLSLYQNYPNPFKPETTIEFYINTSENITLTIHDVTGSRIRMLTNGPLPLGVHKTGWNGENDAGEVVASGIYFYRLTAGGRTLTKKMVLLK